MAALSPRQVAGRYFQIHLYVLLGLFTLAAAVAGIDREQFSIWPPLLGAVICYVGSVLWPHQRPALGRALLVVVAAAALVAALLALPPEEAASEGASPRAIPATAVALWRWLDPITGGLLLGTSMAAMLLGHWYLNAPGMRLQPLRLLVVLIVASTLLRAGLCGTGLLWQMAALNGFPPTDVALFLGLRWLAGLVAPLVLAWMTWQTLKIPNTQSATGILYVVVIVTFIGELTSALLSRQYPLTL